MGWKDSGSDIQMLKSGGHREQGALQLLLLETHFYEYKQQMVLLQSVNEKG